MIRHGIQVCKALRASVCVIFVILAVISIALNYDPSQVGFNLDEDQTAVNPVDFWGEWSNHTYHPSPSNWHFPFYTIFLDRFVNGDPTNDNANGTAFEHDIMANQLRHGGDVQGLVDTLDYLQGIGVKGIYLAGSVFINLPWEYDGYSPIDFTLLDHHFAHIELWQAAITEIHRRGMYVVFDNTVATMSNLIGFEGYLNVSAPFTTKEHQVIYKGNQYYHDFTFGNNYNHTFQYPRFWNETGFPVGTDVTDQLVGCYDSEFDQYGDIEAFGVFPDWQRQLARFASVQDRLREWIPSVREKIQRHACISIAQLDIDGFRFDKATQVTVDAQGNFSAYLRECARNHGKDNFFIAGEITGGNTFGSIYLGRGRQPDQLPANLTAAVTLTNDSDRNLFIRDPGQNALDAAAFHYTIYRSLTRFLGMDGNLEAGYDAPLNWVDAWNDFIMTNDLVNANTGTFDPRHMYSAAFMGEEQAFYVLDNTAPNYLFGRQAMSSATAWQTHGCYHLGPAQFPVESALNGCNDDTVSLDHRDPSAPVRNIIKAMYQMRENYPVLNDGWYLQQLSKQTHYIYLPGSHAVPTETGIWSTMRSRFDGVQDFTGKGKGNQIVWLVYHNANQTITYNFDCTNNKTALISPFDAGTTVKNLFYPYEEGTLGASAQKLLIDGSENFNGCMETLTLQPWEFKAFVPKDQFVGPSPMITAFKPGHDTRLQTQVARGTPETVPIEIHFSAEMDCGAIGNSVAINSTTENGEVAVLDLRSISCQTVTNIEEPAFVGGIPTVWIWIANLTNVYNGIHELVVKNATSLAGESFTNSVDRFMFRIGQTDNPMVFPRQANYTTGLLSTDRNGSLVLSHKAAGADLWRYSLNWGSSYSNWQTYKGGNDTLEAQPWSGTTFQKWSGTHVIVEYWSRLGGSSDHVQHADLDDGQKPPRRFPHLFWMGPYNEYGLDAGLNNELQQEDDGTWTFDFMTEWPTIAQVNVWGINPDGQPDQTVVMGDVDGDSVLDRLPPSTLSAVVINIAVPPPSPYLAWQFRLNDGTFRFELLPIGNQWQQVALYFLLAFIPILTGAIAIWAFMKSLYQVKFNEIGVSEEKAFLPAVIRRRLPHARPRAQSHVSALRNIFRLSKFGSSTTTLVVEENMDQAPRTVLIATMEYDIENWGIKIKIGGLGVMAQLMGKNLGHLNLIWVVPCVSGVDYPEDQSVEPMSVTILGNSYEVQVQYHNLRNITYVLLDAPVFRQQTKSEPYPARMDDLSSAIYYSAWNQCIAEAIKRFHVDLYHINDYHGCLAPIYLLPATIPCCLSLHNAEFQGLWPMRTAKERDEVCRVYNLDPAIVARYVQFGEVFNLLHAGASYLRIHQQGFGAVGVSKKYGKRSYARYPIFLGLKKIGMLPNPDPSDTGEWNKQFPKDEEIKIDPEFEAGRAELKRQAQEWAGLDQNPKADLLVFVGRWSNQKGIDLIADVFPAILDNHPNVQLICVGPVIDLYGKFAALKLDRLMQLYPGRVFSRPEFTTLPPYIFSGAEFAVIPSRDEPFGLVAVEFGRKGALGIGARVGGLGQMPGWWYTVESTTTTHLLHQFKMAIEEALASKPETRAMMRARSAKQRFPVAQWLEDLEILQSTAIKIHPKEAAKAHNQSLSHTVGHQAMPIGTAIQTTDTPGISAFEQSNALLQPLIPTEDNTNGEDPSSYVRAEEPARVQRLHRHLSLGRRAGPGHTTDRIHRRQRASSSQNAAHLPVHTEDNDEWRSVGPGEASEDDSDFSSEAEDEYIITTEQMLACLPQQQFDPSAIESAENDILVPLSYREEIQQQDAVEIKNDDSEEASNGVWGQGTSQRLGYSTSKMDDETLAPPNMPFAKPAYGASAHSLLSMDTVVGEKRDFQLQNVDPFFTDSTEEFYREFEKKLQGFDGKNFDSQLCIEEYLIKSEKKWFERFRDAKLGKDKSSSKPPESSEGSLVNESWDDSSSDYSHLGRSSFEDQYLLGEDYRPPTGLRRRMQKRLGDWPLYAFLLAFGQIIAANSYQITLLTGAVGESAGKLYTLASIT